MRNRGDEDDSKIFPMAQQKMPHLEKGIGNEGWRTVASLEVARTSDKLAILAASPRPRSEPWG